MPPPPRGSLDRGLDTTALAALALIGERARPVAAGRTRLLPVAAPLAGLLPDGVLRRGTTLVVHGPAEGGALSVALALVSAASGAGSWCALVGHPALGAVAAHDLGIDLGRLAVVPRPGAAWAEITAALLEGVDLVLLCPPFPPRPAVARRLVARARGAGPCWSWQRDGPTGPSRPTSGSGSTRRSGRGSGPARGTSAGDG